MRKQTKLVAVLSAAALLAIGASMTSMAAQGWQQEGDDWYYYDNNGDYVVDEWKKSGNNWYYLGDDGYMVKNYLLEDDDDYYYLDGNGVMVTNSWVAIAPDEDDDDDDTPDHYWYYFQSNGRAVKDSGNSSRGFKKKDINGKTYGFDDEGKMLYGFVDESGEKLTSDDDVVSESVYYFGDSDDGAMTKGWLQYMDGADDGEESQLWGGDDGYDDLTEIWFYFSTTNGEKTKGDTSAPKTKTINGNKYAFDENGVMISDWYSEERGDNVASKSKYYNADTEGWMSKNKWVWAIPSADINASDYDNDEYRWFYVDGSGKTVSDTIKKINGKKYIFNENGIMKDGLVVVNNDNEIVPDGLVDEENTSSTQIMMGKYTADNDDGSEEEIGSNKLYYFSDDAATDGSMKTGKSVQIELDDDTYTFGFKKNGEGYNELTDKKIYLNGIRVDASGDYRYQSLFPAQAGDGNGNYILESNTVDKFTDLTGVKYPNYVVGTSGTIVQPGKTVKDADGNYYAVVDDRTTLPGDLDAGTVVFIPDGDDASKIAKDYAHCGMANMDGTDYKTDEDGDYESLGNDCK